MQFRRRTLWERVTAGVRRIFVPRFRGPYYITYDGRQVWRYDPKRFRIVGEPIPIGPNSASWHEWLALHDRLIVQLPTGRAIIRREVQRRTLLTGVKEYSYWRAYMWPARNRRPVRVYVGRIQWVSPDRLITLMGELARRYHVRRKYYLDERRRKLENRRRAAKRRWYKRYRAKQAKHLVC